MRLPRLFAIATLSFAAITLAGCASTPPMLAVPAATADGVLVNPEGITLYVYARDVADSGVSACNGDCAVKWPPFQSAAAGVAPEGYSLVLRPDGRKQWAFRGQPLYTWPEDQEPGDRYGDNYEGVWHVVKPGEPRVIRTVTAQDNDGY